MIRPAKPSDTDAIVELGIESLNNDPYETLVISREKVVDATKECISSSKNFCWVSEVNGKVMGCVAALTTDMLFYERKQASVLMFYCKVPGEGIKLIRELIKWFDSRPILKMLEFTLERNMDERIQKMLKRLGLQTELPIMLRFK